VHRSFTAIGLLLGLVAGGSQTPAAIPLPAPLRTHIMNERFDAVTSLRGFPLGVRYQLQMLIGSQDYERDIAEPTADSQVTTPDNPRLPLRRLAAGGCSMDHCFVYYERAGVSLVALFYSQPTSTRFEWGGIAPRGLKSIEEVLKAVLSGAVKGPNTVW